MVRGCQWIKAFPMRTLLKLNWVQQLLLPVASSQPSRCWLSSEIYSAAFNFQYETKYLVLFLCLWTHFTIVARDLTFIQCQTSTFTTGHPFLRRMAFSTYFFFFLMITGRWNSQSSSITTKVYTDHKHILRQLSSHNNKKKKVSDIKYFPPSWQLFTPT